jgi:hypothetical protein
MANMPKTELTTAGPVDLADIRKMLTGQDVASQRIAAEVDRRADEITRVLMEIGLTEETEPGARLRAIEMMLKISQREEQMRLDTARRENEQRTAELREKAARTLERMAQQGLLTSDVAESLKGA